MGAWMAGKNRRGIVDGICHICKAPADGPPLFETRFCYRCLQQGMDLEGWHLKKSPYAIIPILFRIKTTYEEIAQDIRRASYGSAWRNNESVEEG